MPAKNESDVIEPALSAISVAASRIELSALILVLANDCVDATAEVVRRYRCRTTIPIHVIECALPPCRADAGRARRIAMAAAHRLTNASGFIVSTDADALLQPDTLQAFVSRFDDGADIVCGTTSTDLPPHFLHTLSVQRLIRATERYAALATDVRYAADLLYGLQSQTSKPHYVESGACLAVSARLLQLIGGVPDVPFAEDRALVRRAGAAGGRVAYCDRAHALVSARLDGRAAGGMAATLRRTLVMDDPIADEALRSYADIRSDWEEVVFLSDGGKRPPVRTATPRLRASDLERDLPYLSEFVREVVTPRLVDVQVTGAMA